MKQIVVVFETSFFEMPFLRSVSFENVSDDNLDKSIPFWAVIYWNAVFPKCHFCEVALLEMSVTITKTNGRRFETSCFEMSFF